MAVKMWDSEDYPDYGMTITYQGQSLLSSVTALLIGGPKNGETFAVEKAYWEKQFPITFAEQEDYFPDTFSTLSSLKYHYYHPTGFSLNYNYVYALEKMHPAMIKFELIQYQLNSLNFYGKIDLFGLTEEEHEYIKKLTGFSINFVPPKPKFIPGENCLFT